MVWCEGLFLFLRIQNLVECFRKHDGEYLMVDAELHLEHWVAVSRHFLSDGSVEMNRYID